MATDDTSKPSREGTDFASPRGLAVRVLSRIEQTDAYLDKLLESEMRVSALDTRDRRLLTEIATGVVRWQRRLDWVLRQYYRGDYDRCTRIVRNAMRVALYQILHLDRVPVSAAVNESVSIVKGIDGSRAAGIVNGVLRSVVRQRGSIAWPDRSVDEIRYLSIMYSQPRWMVRRWVGRFGPVEAERLLAANNQRARTSVRVNRLRCSKAELAQRCSDAGMRVESSRYVEGALLVDRIGSIADDPLFLRGMYTVQDEGSQLAARLTGARPGQFVVDLCAGPGGKTTALAEMMRGEGKILAVDRYAAKVELIRNASERLGLAHIISAQVEDARVLECELADIVLVDAPCSGLGVLSRRPDIRWKRREEDIAATASLALEILRHGAHLVAPGGRIVYTTCTIEPEENDVVVESFLDEHREFELVPAEQFVPHEVTDGPFLRTLPHIHGTDGVFGAIMRRTR